jgi:glycosyltransferase involved in cell wall biosynthesis
LDQPLRHPAIHPASQIEAKPARADSTIEVSFVMPCLNERETIARCVEAAQRCIQRHGLAAEIVIGDNGSTDGSRELARAAGARVIEIPVRGVGAAIMGAVAAARGRYIIMGDSDLQHDFEECYPFIEKLRTGHFDLVMGSRLTGTIMPGAMRTLNRYVGNPLLSAIGRLLFRAPVSDFHCGLRAFTKESFDRLGLRTIGFEFTTEHIAKTALKGQRIAEIPITVHPEGRTRPPHLRPFRDGWRTLRFMLLLSPRWTLAIPGAIIALVGFLLAALVATGPFKIAGLAFDIHTLVLACMMVLVGYTATTIAVAARLYALVEEIGPPAPNLSKLTSKFTLERGLLFGLALLAAGLALVGITVYQAFAQRLELSNVTTTLRPTIIGATLIALGAQTLLMSFFYSMLGVRHTSSVPPIGTAAPASSSQVEPKTNPSTATTR